ncbi:MAG TPA: SUMF1/EgtB/PvdO family nonheme iron enzyme [Polyangiaceae bacterium]|nr:SUMF1/EgtB/PvdO family nonheme iron enzyme [Polyangiaceae bacterium]
MVLVQGNYCPNVEQRCLEHGKEGKSTVDSETICMKFEKPSVCLSAARVPMRFCMDRYEYPNTEGELPRVLTTWLEASQLCKQQGKRLCSESEFNFACEGEDMLPYSYGFDRDASKCNQDKEYRLPPEEPLRPIADCMRDKRCTATLAKLDQREPIGSHPNCVSPFGVFDLNGNANEFVMLRYKQPPNRSALKGGWWGPVRARCRPIVTHHDEKYLGYEVGFRCCSKPLDAEDAKDGKGARKGKKKTRGRGTR